MLVIVHREELADQAADKLKRWNPSLRVGVEMGAREASSKDNIIVGSVQTLGRKGSLRLAKFQPKDFGVVVCDKAHHSVADSYKTVFDHFDLRTPENKKLLLGVTATPNRADGLALGQVYDEIVYQIPILDAIKQGWLADMRGIKVRTDTTLDNVHTRAGDFAQDELQNAVNTPYRNGLIVQEWLKNASGLQTLAFTVDIAHAQHLAAVFKSYGVSSEAIWGDDPFRAEKLALHREGKLQVLTNCAVLTEGYDDWQIKCIVMARPTKSQLLFVQMAGRGTRIPNNISNLLEAKALGLDILKDNCLLIDVVDNTTRHSLVTMASIFGLSEKMDMRGKPITRVLSELEKAQAEHKGLDISKLEDIDKLQSYAEEVDLFHVKFSDEVMQYSELQWHTFGPETYRLLLPNGEKVVIWKDLFGEWEVAGTVRGNSFKESHIQSLPEAFKWQSS